MAIEDVIRDLNTYFDSIKKPVQIRAHMGGIVNPSYLTVIHGIRQNVLPFWSVAGGSSREKDLAKAFQEDIEAWINRPEPVVSENEITEPARPKRGKKATTEAE